MNSAVIKMLSRWLIVALALLPFHGVQAGVIDTAQAASAEGVPNARQALLNLLDRTEVASQLQRMGLESGVAKNRVAAMTDAEVRTLTRELETLPAAGSSPGGKNYGWGIVGAFVIAWIIWYTWK